LDLLAPGGDLLVLEDKLLCPGVSAMDRGYLIGLVVPVGEGCVVPESLFGSGEELGLGHGAPLATGAPRREVLAHESSHGVSDHGNVAEKGGITDRPNELQG
jgi:hypothetical protein